MTTILTTATGMAGWGLLVLLFVGYHRGEYEDPATAVEWLRTLASIAG